MSLSTRRRDWDKHYTLDGKCGGSRGFLTVQFIRSRQAIGKHVASRRLWRQYGAVLCMVCVVAVLSACSGGGDSGDSDEAASSPTIPPLTGPPVVGEPVWSRSIDPQTNEPAEAVESFADTDRVLYLSVPIERLPAGTEIDALWSYNDTQLEGSTVQLIADRDQTGGWIEVHLERTSEEPWPDGTYRVQLQYQSTPIANSEVEITET